MRQPVETGGRENPISPMRFERVLSVGTHLRGRHYGQRRSCAASTGRTHGRTDQTSQSFEENPCQRGAVHTRREQVTFIGEAREYTRPTESGNTFSTFFCPVCATSLYWYGSRDPSRIGVAVGCFDASEELPPDRSVYDVNKQAWVEFGDIPGFERGRDSPRTR